MSKLTPPRWQRIQALCETIEALPPEQRDARLRVLESDPTLRQEAMALLKDLQDEAEHQRLHYSAVKEDGTLAQSPLPETIGGVRIVAHIGTGGSGDVFRGVRTTNGTLQAVAVKRFHALRASAEDLERFAREQRMLATLTHPAIVRFIDAGVEGDGRPYLVMELADGMSIIDYCDVYALSLEERLKLFLSVCDAVRSAHQHQILHLDLKPSNVLVTGAGEERHVKLVDFGTAKLADPTLDPTRTEPLTVQYASPERLRGDPVTAACDVYGLGLMLYELASGGWPYRRPESLVAIAERASGGVRALPLWQAVTDEGALRRGVASDRLRSALRGDLEAIAAKAIAHDPAQRYFSVAALADDVRRHLSNEPILARPPRFSYVASRWVRRHRWPAASAAVAIVAVAAAGVYSYFVRKPDGLYPAPMAGTFAAEMRVSTHRPNNKAGGIQTFDDFMSPNRTTITGLSWKGVYCGNVADAPAPKPNAFAFLIGFYADKGNEPDQKTVLHSAMYPAAQIAETLEAEQLAPCANVRTGWSHYRYRTKLDTPFVAQPGVRYWLSIQAWTNELRLENAPWVHWGWQGALGSNRRSVVLREDGTRLDINIDRIYSLHYLEER